MIPGARTPADARLGTSRLGDGEDQGLLLRAREGDGAAVAQLYDRHAGALYALACCVLGRSAAEDVVVDAMVDSCGRGAAGRSPHRSVRHELARATYGRFELVGALSPTERSRAVLALCLHGDHTYREACALTGESGACLGHLLRGALGERTALPLPA